NSAPLGFGSFSYSASFAGDSNYKPAGPATCEPLTVYNAPLTPGYWKTHMASTSKGSQYYDSLCSDKKFTGTGAGCSSNGPFTKQFLSQTLGGYSVSNIALAALVFQKMNCSSTKDN